MRGERKSKKGSSCRKGDNHLVGELLSSASSKARNGDPVGKGINNLVGELFIICLLFWLYLSAY